MSSGPFPHVVACVDDSPATEAVVRMAQRLVADGGRISVTHVLGGPPFSESFLAAIGTAFGGSPLGDNTGAHREIAQALLETVCDGVPGAVPVLLDPHDADSAPDAVVTWADDNDADAIVAASHGDPLTRAVKLVGSFSAHLARHASCPVVLLPPGTTADDS